MRHAPKLRDFVNQRIPKNLKTSLTPEDVLQDVWMDAFRTWNQLDASRTNHLERWLCTLAKRRLVDKLRSARSIKRGKEAHALRQNSVLNRSYSDLFRLIAGSGRTPSSQGAAIEASAAVQLAMRDLPEPYRTAISLCHIEQHPRQIAAQMMNTSVRALDGVLYRGLHMLRQQMGKAERYFSDTA